METSSPHQENEHTHGTLRSYCVGFFFSIVLTMIPYLLVVRRTFSVDVTILLILCIALLQLLVQLVYFLHLNTKSEQRWNLVVFVFTVIVVLIIGVGSLWVMYHLEANMMPGPELEKAMMLDEGMMMDAKL